MIHAHAKKNNEADGLKYYFYTFLAAAYTVRYAGVEILFWKDYYL